MSSITDVWQQLVRRRLWPLAVLLVGALVAVPFLLSKDPEPVAALPAPTAPAATASADNATAEPVVALADEGTARRRRVLGARKDPFAPAPVPKVAKKKTATATATGTTATGSTQTTGGSSSPTGGGSSGAPTTGGTPAKKKKKKTYPADSLTVRFGADDTLEKSTLEVGEPLPETTGEDEQPLLVYLGLAKGGKEALFLVDASVVAEGDGRCDSDGGTTCETLHLRAGETEFLDVTDDAGEVTGKFQLDLVAIHVSKKTAAAAAAASAKRAKTAGAATTRAAQIGEAAAGSPAIGVAGVARLLAGL
jgi:hypothetical protein